jgi:hypothetical protein
MTSQLLGKSRERERDNEGPKDPPRNQKGRTFRAQQRMQTDIGSSRSKQIDVRLTAPVGMPSSVERVTQPRGGVIVVVIVHMVIHPNPSGCCS